MEKKCSTLVKLKNNDKINHKLSKPLEKSNNGDINFVTDTHPKTDLNYQSLYNIQKLLLNK